MMKYRLRSIYPNIFDASPLGGYKLLIDWSSGEQTIFDASPCMTRSKALLYRSEEDFKKVQVHPHFLYWGDEDFIIMKDDVYELSFPYSAIVSPAGNPMFLSIVQVENMTTFPIRKIALDIHVYVHGKDADRHKEPHIHIYLGVEQTNSIPFKIDGLPISGMHPPNPPYSRKILRNIQRWIVNNHEAIIVAWNKENPSSVIEWYSPVSS